ncbi:MAG: xanthine dehydrogenase, partial [Bdellovibrionota bacterium]|nr:xanthine dehydrogenase [Bdellovibrionota bacterium]
DLLKLYKVSLRKDLDISAVTFACQTQIKENKITNIKLAYGGVGPVVKRLEETENFLEGKPWNEETIKKGMKLVENEITPISDIRGSAKFRTQVSKNLLLKFFNESQR